MMAMMSLPFDQSMIRREREGTLVLALADKIPPIAAPELNIPCAKARSLTGNHSALALAAPGQLPASATPRIVRKI